MALNMGEHQLQTLAGQHETSAQQVSGQLNTHMGHVTEMASAMQGTAATAYQNVSANTLHPAMSSFINALNEHASNLRTAGGALDAANQDNTSRVGASAGNTSTSALNFPA